MDLENKLTAPKFCRKLSLRKDQRSALIVQEVEDFLPHRTTLYEAGRIQELAHDTSLGFVRDRFLSSGPASCVVHLKEDIEVIIHDIDTPKKLSIEDKRYGQNAEIAESLAALAPMQIEEANKAAEAVYLRHNAVFTDPYQYVDPREEPLNFITGSEAELRARIADLFHAFPKIFETVPEPRFFVYTGFDRTEAAFNAHASHHGHKWNAENYFLSLARQIIRENTPQGFCYRSRTGGLERRGEFQKDALVLTVVPGTPSPKQVQAARDKISAFFSRYGLTLNPEIFEGFPFQEAS